MILLYFKSKSYISIINISIATINTFRSTIIFTIKNTTRNIITITNKRLVYF